MRHLIFEGKENGDDIAAASTYCGCVKGRKLFTWLTRSKCHIVFIGSEYLIFSIITLSIGFSLYPCVGVFWTSAMDSLGG